MAPLPNDNLAYPVLIQAGSSNGSGFFLNRNEASYLVTAKHVLFDQVPKLISQQLRLSCLANDLNTQIHIDVDAAQTLAGGHLKLNPNADVAILKLGNVQGERLVFVPGVTMQHQMPDNVQIIGLGNASTTPLDDVGVSNDVYVLSYPVSLGINDQIDRTRPLLRKGIVAGKTADRRIVIDCPVYFGNSGGLVIEVTQIDITQHKFNGIGIVTQLVPFVETLKSEQYKSVVALRHENSGYALVEPIDRVIEIL